MKQQDEHLTRPIITRRDILKGAALGTVGLALGLNPLAAAGVVKPPLFAAENPKSTAVLIRRANAVNQNNEVQSEIVAEMLETALQTLTGQTDGVQAFGQYLRPADTVGIKFTRCAWMRIPTEQAMIDAVKKQVIASGVPEKQIFAQDGGLPVKQCTALLNLPSVKVHSLTGISAALKNYINFSGNPSAYHYDNSVKLGEVWHLPDVKGKTRLIIVDLLRPYFGPGPQVNPLHRWNYQGMLVGTDPVALDTVCLKICQEKRNLFEGEEWLITPPPKSIAAADAQYGLGTSDPTQIKLLRVGWEEDLLI